jgi:hypothetical protein
MYIAGVALQQGRCPIVAGLDGLQPLPYLGFKTAHFRERQYIFFGVELKMLHTCLQLLWMMD